jgi:hypothetical protein
VSDEENDRRATYRTIRDLAESLGKIRVEVSDDVTAALSRLREESNRAILALHVRMTEDRKERIERQKATDERQAATDETLRTILANQAAHRKRDVIRIVIELILLAVTIGIIIGMRVPS